MFLFIENTWISYLHLYRSQCLWLLAASSDTLGELILLYTSVWLQEQQDWQEDLVYFVYWINIINKQIKYLAGWQVFIWSAARGCFDLVWRCCRVMLTAAARDSTARVISTCLIYSFLTSNTSSRKYYLWKKKMIGWKVDLFL